MTQLVLGIDPGATGAVAFLTPDGQLMDVQDIPVDVVQVGKHSRSRLSRHRLLAMLENITDAVAFVEQPTYRPMNKTNLQTGQTEKTQMGVAGAGAFGETYGGITMAVAASGIAVVEVRPDIWSRAIGMKGGKDDARRMAQDMFPVFAKLFARVKDHNRAEAVLIGLWGTRELAGARRAA